jgi:hypothetical protein
VISLAIKARDAVAIAAWRCALAVIENAEAVEVLAAPHLTGSQYVAGAVPGQGAEVERRELSGTDERELVQSQVDQRTIAAQEYETLGHQDAADRLRAEADVLRGYL